MNAPIKNVGALPRITIHTDGGCQGNPGVGAWACVLEGEGRKREHSGGVPATTNNRMELQAAIEALRLLKRPCAVEFFTDSDYVRQGITKWVAGWKRNGWRTAAKTPVKNRDLWQELDPFTARHQITWRWVKGHAGHALNERCDQLAGAAMARVRKQFTTDQLRTALAEFKRFDRSMTGHLP